MSFLASPDFVLEELRGEQSAENPYVFGITAQFNPHIKPRRFEASAHDGTLVLSSVDQGGTRRIFGAASPEDAVVARLRMKRKAAEFFADYKRHPIGYLTADSRLIDKVLPIITTNERRAAVLAALRHCSLGQPDVDYFDVNAVSRAYSTIGSIPKYLRNEMEWYGVAFRGILDELAERSIVRRISVDCQSKVIGTGPEVHTAYALNWALS